jgi:hypothetical protein
VSTRSRGDPVVEKMRDTYRELLNDSADAQGGGRLEGQHRVLALYSDGLVPGGSRFGPRLTYVEGHELLPVAVEGVVVELNELLCRIGTTCQPLYHHIDRPNDIAVAASVC